MKMQIASIHSKWMLHLLINMSAVVLMGQYSIINSDTTALPFRNKILVDAPLRFHLDTKLSLKKFEVRDLPLFCRLEHEIENKAGVPFRFRLGNLQYVNMLENKNKHIFAE